MEKQEQIVDSPTGWVADHVRDYVASDGAKGLKFHGVDTLLITTRGRRTGQLRRTALIFGKSGDDYLLVASNGGADKHPYWYTNLVATPEVAVQVGAEQFTAKARTATAAERAGYWATMAAIFPLYEEYQTKATREIPVVVLERE
jgi:deazaflavin-dependent oxidoreductase (nitroreductase family)